ncbi:MAG TPA: hypothetical protein VF695_14990 [Sphingomonas sp.]|jgi:hypothetical protein
MFLIDNVRVDIPGEYYQSYNSALVSLAAGFMSFSRPDIDTEYGIRISPTGAHIHLSFPTSVLMQSPLGKEAQFSFSGVKVGELARRYGRPDMDDGTGLQDVVQFSTRSRLDKDSFWMTISGKLNASDKGWLSRQFSRNEESAARSFEIRMEVTTAELLTAVERDLKEVLKRVCGMTE